MSEFKIITGDKVDYNFQKAINDNTTLTKDELEKQKGRVDNLIKGVEQPSEVVDARGGLPVLKDRLDSFDEELAQNAKKIDGNFFSVKSFGAVGDGTLHPLSEYYSTLTEAQVDYPKALALTDSIDWAAIQKCIDEAYQNNVPVYLPDGSYVVNRSFELPESIIIYGNHKTPNGYQDTNKRTSIRSSAQHVFITGSITKISPTIKGIHFYCTNGDPDNAYVFYAMQLHHAKIQENTFVGFGRIFACVLWNVCLVSENVFDGVRKYFMRNDDIPGYETTATLVDSFVYHNYINGKPETNATGFVLHYPTTSFIQDNYIDFFYRAFLTLGQIETTHIVNNVIDVCYRGITGFFTRGTIRGNTFNKIKKSYASYFPNATTDMINNDWVGIECTSGFSDVTVSDNITRDSDTFLSLKDGYNIKNAKVIGNSYSGVTNKIILSSIKLSGSTGDFQNCMFDDLMYKRYATLPNPTITSTGGELRVTTFDQQIINYNGKMVYNDNESWKDLLGVTVS